MKEDILFDNRHKFVYFEENKRGWFKNNFVNDYNEVDMNQPMPVYIKDNGLPKINSSLDLDKYRIIAFHDRYYEFLIALSVVDTLIDKVDKEVLNKKLSRMFRLCSNCSKKEIENIDDLRDALYNDKVVYENGYKKYLETGKLDFIDDLLLITVTLDIFIKNIKRAVGLKGHFSVLLDYDELTIDNMKIINKYINSRCNGYLSINILCGERKWDIYYDNMGYLVQYIHDYDEVDYRNEKKRVRHN